MKSLIDSKAFSFNKDLEEVDDWEGSTLNSQKVTNPAKPNVDFHATHDSTFKNEKAKDQKPKPKDEVPTNRKKFGFAKYKNAAVITQYQITA